MCLDEKDPQYNSADIAWVLVSTALVFLNDSGSCILLWWNG